MVELTFQGFGGIHIAGNAFGSVDDPPVLLLPPSGQTKEFWFGSAAALANAGRYAICVDLRGHGDSGHSTDGNYSLEVYSSDLTAILAALPSRAVVVAAGLGALVAIAAVGDGAPNLVSGLTLVDANIWIDGEVEKRMGEAMRNRTTVFANADKIVDAIATAYPGEPRPALTERMLSAYTVRADGQLEWRGDPKVLEDGNLSDMQERLTAAASRIATPVTLLRGSLNETITGESILKLQGLIKGSEVAEIEGAGHYAAVDREDTFNSILLDFLERKAPRQPLKYIGGSEPRILRDALGCFGTGVTVVTTIDNDGNTLGLTANSFTSVSLDPPLVLFSLAKSSANLATFEEVGRFAVNVLHIGQQPTAVRFTQRDVDRFEGVDWAIRAEGGSPILAGSLASFDCRTHAVHDGGDHLIFVGHVDHAWFEPHRDPLLYFRGRFQRLHFS
jgi:flavin reductase (DIM6/NTAB) family NADH-FMN oxidoreductase RutF/pimeloyl-ACP methyl ester carboxylesterase